MKNMKRPFILLLALCLFISPLCACGTVEGGEDTAAGTEKTETSTEWAQDNVPDVNYGGADFVILTQQQVDAGPKTLDDMVGGDVLDAAVWERNRYVETRLGVTISSEQQSHEEINATVRQCVSSGDLAYHTVFAHMVSGTQLASGGYLYNLNRLESIDKDAPWWDRDVGRGFEVGGALYMTAGDILPFTLLTTCCISFNKNAFNTRGLEYPYETAKNGAWTIDALLALTEGQTYDLNGDGVIRPEDDFYGYTAHNLAAPFDFFFGSGCTMIGRDENDMPVYEADTEKIQNVYDKVYNLVFRQNALYVKDDSGDAFFAGYRAFSEGRVLIASTYLHQIYTPSYGYKDMKDEYGLLPQPKYDLNQKEYLSFVNGAASMVTVMNLVKDEETEDYIGNVIEALGSASYNMVTYTLYELTCKAKNVNDPQSAEMVDIIIRHRVFDFGYAHFFGEGLACSTLFRDALNAGNESISSRLKTAERQTTNALKKMTDAYAKGE